jgi:hypothetical protein
VNKGIDTGGCVLRAGGVKEKGARSLRRVEVAGCGTAEGAKTDGRVVRTRGEGEERISALRGIAAGIASVRRRDNCLRCWEKRKARLHDEEY